MKKIEDTRTLDQFLEARDKQGFYIRLYGKHMSNRNKKFLVNYAAVKVAGGCDSLEKGSALYRWVRRMRSDVLPKEQAHADWLVKMKAPR